MALLLAIVSGYSQKYILWMTFSLVHKNTFVFTLLCCYDFHFITLSCHNPLNQRKCEVAAFLKKDYS